MMENKKNRYVIPQDVSGKSKQVNFGKNWSEKYIKSVVAFANTAGDKIVIGVDNEILLRKKCACNRNISRSK